ncbi:MAG: hypothetical protein WBC76_08990 [Actinomycetes bacterium]|jgi:hypothetical protein|nr:hypothetical protein [Actinomycetes bacterium]
MFVQIMQGKVKDADLLDKQMDAWSRDFKPHATGFLGSTSGIDDNGNFIAIARFESEEAARKNSDRPEQGEWWEAMTSAFDGDVEFIDSTEVDAMFGGGSDSAGFVQIMQGRAVDPTVMRGTAEQMEKELQKARPDILGGLVAWHGDREFTQAIYFVSEQAARKGEQEMTDDPTASEWDTMLDGEITFIDLREPRFD